MVKLSGRREQYGKMHEETTTVILARDEGITTKVRAELLN